MTKFIVLVYLVMAMLVTIGIVWLIASGHINDPRTSLPTQIPYVVVVTATPAVTTATPTSATVSSATATPEVRSVAIQNDGPGDVTARYTWRNEQGTPTLVLDQIIVPRESITFTVGSKYDQRGP